ncbi:MAG: hypothetical protein JWO03_1895 [Bacteroidetes bacterium]|nr:hypothetical protein [Bacteroidota bacterium]
MDTTTLEHKTQRIIDEYIRDLDSYTYEQLLIQPAPGSWSMGQVYIHLWMSAKGFFFKKADLCLTSGDGTVRGKGKNWKGVLVFLIGKMPTIRVKMPGQVAVEPRQPESKEQIIAKLTEIRQLASDYIKQIPFSDPSIKARHPFLGYLNTGEWISLCNMHFHHHEAQKIRIKKHFNQ